MGSSRNSLSARLSLGIVLFAASSCTPGGPHGAHISQTVPAASPRQLLRDLALDVPEVAALPRSLTASAADDAAPAFAQAAPAFFAQARSDEDARRAAECLTAAVYYEARSEPLDGQRAVAQVVLNRVRDRAFPHSVCGVVYQGSQRRTGCQFSFTCDGSMAFRRDPLAWSRAAQVAAAALAGQVYAPIGSATFYHANYVLPWWASSLTRIGSVGAHIFYRWRGAMEQALSFRASYVGVEPGIASAVPLAPAPASEIAAVYRDATDDSGVTVHRGRAKDLAAAAPVAKMVTAGGVRVHFGRQGPDREVSADGVVVEAESDPI
ncbi:cell wall hydrolase [Sphingomonas sp. MA1305]|uniref:cell wall hydrolase n=1 Tax=Sphingomonas sp. MA1305 TaxID=2479204 RepID=UPI002FCCE061